MWFTLFCGQSHCFHPARRAQLIRVIETISSSNANHVWTTCINGDAPLTPSLFGVVKRGCASVPRHSWCVLFLETLTVSEVFKESQGSLEAALQKGAVVMPATLHTYLNTQRYDIHAAPLTRTEFTASNHPPLHSCASHWHFDFDSKTCSK